MTSTMPTDREDSALDGGKQDIELNSQLVNCHYVLNLYLYMSVYSLTVADPNCVSMGFLTSCHL